MPVVFKGGPSGMRQDYSPPVPDSGSSQPVLRTETHGAVPSSIYLKATNPSVHVDHYQSKTPDFMPTGCDCQAPDATSGGGTDIMDPGASQGSWGPGVNAVNTPYTGPSSAR